MGFEKEFHFNELIEGELYSSYNKYTYTKREGKLYNFSKGKYSSLKPDFLNRIIFKSTNPLKRCVKCGDYCGEKNKESYICRICGYKYKIGDKAVYWKDVNRYEIK